MSHNEQDDPPAHFRGTDGRYSSFEVEIKRLDQLRQAGDLAVAAALAAQEKATSAALAASDKAINKAEVAQQHVNEGQNEFRLTLKDQAATLMPRAETELLVVGIRKDIADIKKVQDEGTGRFKGAIDSRTLLFSVFAALGTALGVYLAISSLIAGK
jgi:methylase of polypeptide subunit release factors